MSMKNSNETIENRTRNLSACSTVPQPSAPPYGGFDLQGELVKQQHTLKMGTHLSPETSVNLRILTRLSVQENFIEYIHTHTYIHTYILIHIYMCVCFKNINPYPANVEYMVSS